MATAHATQSKTSKARSASRPAKKSTEGLSGERDVHYNLISVLYHGLQGADQCALYAQDADEAGDAKLADFLRSAGESQGDLARRAKKLLVERLGSSRRSAASDAGDDEILDDEEDDDVG